MSEPSAFVQAVVAAMERCALFLFRHLGEEAEVQLTIALRAVRADLHLPAPRHPYLDCRDWPADEQSSTHLHSLLQRFTHLEREDREG